MTRELLVELVEEILVNSDKSITIRFKFEDAYKEVHEYIKINEDVVQQ